MQFWLTLRISCNCNIPPQSRAIDLEPLKAEECFLRVGRWQEIGGDCSHRETAATPHVFNGEPVSSREEQDLSRTAPKLDG
jgi:hypothetical protein